MTPERETIRVQLNYPLERVKEPVLYHLIIDYGLVPNIRAANIDVRTGGFIYLELTGGRPSLDSALEYLANLGVTVSALGVDGTQEWAV